ncbi:anhydro-N-acetylmuramic acid kinase [Solimonas soli]|uniref:anhydro-N-acetylmuramic acid kinase n=1 Tax=Solimonas soli TaxID=413479 RepID=UPI00047FA525|nr:anhydro-N-acetylmuramic acid kinase [Solimonas soli]
MSGGICVGLISGTSLDAVDAAACEFDAEGRWRRLLGTHSESYPSALRQELLDLQRRPDTAITLRDVTRLDAAIGDCFAQAAARLLEQLSLRPPDVDAIGSHGQTVFHDPLTIRSSLQLGDPNRIAARTGVRTIADFRRADMTHGGQGAPLMPAFHQAVFGGSPCVVANIGGISNITVLGAADAPVFGFDTGPGNALLDDWIQREKGLAYDRGGEWARSAEADRALLAACLRDPYLALPPPKSTGRDYFNLDWLARRTDALPADAAVIQRTLLELTVESLSRAIDAEAPKARELFVCGGGARNGFLMERLAQRLPRLRVADTSARGLDPDWVEAAGFAWLAWRTARGRPGNLPSVTGAGREVVLGGIYAP